MYTHKGGKARMMLPEFCLRDGEIEPLYTHMDAKARMMLPEFVLRDRGIEPLHTHKGAKAPMMQLFLSSFGSHVASVISRGGWLYNTSTCWGR